ncbi:MAG: hypothetical protein QXN55_01225 [Candidatus Nitrosotenuis sp.]
MDEILNKLLESELLSDETKTEVSTLWNSAVSKKMAEIKEEVELEVRAELAEQWTKDREAFITKVDTFVSEQLATELADLRGDIERFRDLEVEYSERLVEEKKKIAEEVAKEMDSLVDKIDAFFELRIAEEMAEFKEDLEIVKQNEFGRRVFEAFASEYANSHVDEDSASTKLSIAESKVADLTKRLAALETEKNKMIRESKMAEVLKPLTGEKRESMAFILQNVETNKLEEAYKHFIGRILKEEKTSSEKKEEILKESTTKVVTGEEKNAEIIKEEKSASTLATSSNLEQIRRLAGIKK